MKIKRLKEMVALVGLSSLIVLTGGCEVEDSVSGKTSETVSSYSNTNKDEMLLDVYYIIWPDGLNLNISLNNYLEFSILDGLVYQIDYRSRYKVGKLIYNENKEPMTIFEFCDKYSLGEEKMVKANSTKGLLTLKEFISKLKEEKGNKVAENFVDLAEKYGY